MFWVVGVLCLHLVIYCIYAALRSGTRFDVEAFLKADAASEKEAADPRGPRRKVVVVLNPVAGGRGQSLKIWAQVRAVLSEFAPHMEVSLMQTAAAGHAQKWAAEELTADVDTVLCIGGDGTLFEVVQGVLARPDAAKIAQAVALAVVPAGTGNGLAKSLGIEPWEVEKAAAYCIRGKRVDLDVMKAVQGPRTWYCFLFMAYGLIADCDFESEAYRFLGNFRFYIAVIFRVIFKRRYRVNIVAEASMEYTQCDEPGKPLKDPLWNADIDVTGLMVCNCPFITHDFMAAPRAAISDGCMHLTFGSDKMSRLQIVYMLVKSATGDYVNLDCVRYLKASRVRVSADGAGMPRFPWDDPARSGKFDLDGEPMPPEPIELTVHNVKLQICG